jgi:hypothetical protein
MPITDPNERARRAVIRSIVNVTELVEITIDDPNDQDPDPLAFQVDPDNLFDLAFSRVGITSAALLSGFVAGLRRLLPEISDRIQELLSDLQPGVQIKLVFNVIRRELARPPEAVAASKAAAKKGAAKKAAAKKTAAKKTAAKKTAAKKSSNGNG